MVTITLIILTFNSEASIECVITSCTDIASRVIVVDSGSTDGTRDIATRLGCEILHHPFENYSAQRNWAQREAHLADDDWVLHIDADEVVSTELATSIKRVMNKPSPDIEGYLVRRLSYFLGHPIRYGHINPSWHLRLFRAGKGRCEDRLYDQHFIVSGKTESLSGVLHDLQLTNLEGWTAAHNRWSTAEASEMMLAKEPNKVVLNASLFGDIRMKKRWLKNNVWYKMPLLLRPMIFFIYSYFFKLGFLDGKSGLIYHFLQAFWFRFLVDAKIYESKIPPSKLTFGS